MEEVCLRVVTSDCCFLCRSCYCNVFSIFWEAIFLQESYRGKNLLLPGLVFLNAVSLLGELKLECELTCMWVILSNPRPGLAGQNDLIVISPVLYCCVVVSA